ncbi:uncharacterized protein LOC111137051 [Crassostrea virginica]
MLDKGCKTGEKVTTDEKKLKAGGRNRFCKQCKFTCTDPKDFLTHQKFVHSQEKDPDILISISKRRKSSGSINCNSQGSALLKKIPTRSSVSHDTDEKQTIVNGKNSDSSTFQPNEESHTFVNSEIFGSASEDEALDPMNKENHSINDNKKRILSDESEKIEKDINNMDSTEMERTSNFGSEHEEQDEEGKLIIAEDEHLSSKSKTPTRSGNIQNRTYVCNQCEFSSTSAKTFLHHQKDEHQPDIIIYECDICEYATKYKQKLPRHRKLHFTGKDTSSLLGAYDLDSSLNETKDRSGSFHDSMRMDENNPNFIQNVVDDDDDDDEEDEEEETLPQNETQDIPSTPDGAPPVEKKKRKTRQEVDPGKYFEVQDDTGIKYACSKCGNVYKWRKSLNKHWKEKHFGDIPDSSVPPPGLAKLNSLNHVQYSYRFPTPKGADRLSPASQRGEKSRSETPVSMVERYQPGSELMENSNMSSVVMPRFIGPFITDSVSGEDHAPSKVETMFPRSLMESSREQPIDFSVKKENDYSSFLKASQSSPTFKTDQAWSEQTSSLDLSGNKKEESPILQCNRCSFVAKTLVDYSSHMTLHLNKRAFKCAECQEHFNNVEDLNKHFGENHAEKIHEHKEAIQKIPHGLQQTYHLLKMPLNAIGSIAVSEASTTGPNEPKYLKCSMCSFVAKWPAELQKHAVSHSEERPFVCMVCGSTYKWKWDLVKHFEKSHNSLTNPYKRREQGSPAPLNTKSEQNSGLKSPPVLSPVSGFHGDRSMYPMTSTAAALIDTDTFHKRGIESLSFDEPFRKKRRLSDTDMPNLMDQSQGDSQDYGFMGYEDSRANESASNDSQNSFKISGTSALRDMENLIPPEDEKGNDPNEMFGTCSINPQTQMAVINAVKKRLDNGKPGNVPSKSRPNDKDKNSDVLLPYKCQICEYRARWPSEITQHMKNHSDEKPYHCPRCSYKSKWKWDVVKHLKRCGGGTIRDVIDTNKIKKHSAPPNVTVMPQGSFQRQGLNVQSESIQRSMESRFAASSVAEALANSNGGIMSMADSNKNSYDDYEKMMTLASTQQPIFKSIVNQGAYQCFECPFIAQSPAELKRHAVLHSENKPFCCTICGYSSRWKCDLKKHIRTYGHFDQSLQSKSNSQHNPSEKFLYQIPTRDLYQEEQDSVDRTLYTCNKCPYSTFKKYSFEIHMKTHGDIKREDSSAGKYNCKQCEFQGTDLISLLQHKKTHTGKPAANISALELSSEPVSSRTMQKHRRKPVQQFRCPKCPYTCFKRSGLTMHEAMHQPRGDSALKCYYCDYNVFSKGLLVQHMRLHPEFDPNECSEFAEILENNDFDNMDTEEDEYLRSMNEDDMDDYSMMDEDSRQSPSDLNSSGSSIKAKESRALDLSSSSITSFSSENWRASSSGMFEQPDSRGSPMQFPCEWCSSRFPNLTTLYHHATTRHPMELRLQELGESPSMALPTRMNDPYLERQKRLQQKQELQKQELEQQKLQQLEQHFQQPMVKSALNQSRYRPIEPKLPFTLSEKTSSNPVYSSPATSTSTSNLTKFSQDANNNKSGFPISQSSTLVAQALLAKAKKSTSPNKRGRSFQCTKCSFTAPNAVTYLRHIERHGSNCRHTCRFCDYSIDRLNLLYQHMKGTHGDLWRGTPEEKINLTSTGGKGYSDDMHSKERSTPDMNSDSLNNSLDGSFTGSLSESEISDEAFNFSMNEIKVYHTMAAKGQNPVLSVKEETTCYGIPIQVCTINNRRSYKCPKCIFVNSNLTTIVNHVKLHGSTRRISCEKCDIGVDNLRQLEIHYECLHPQTPVFIECSPSKIPFVSESSNSGEENNNSFVWSKSSQRASNLILPTCTKCPYKCRTVEMLQYHLTLHNLAREHKCNYCNFSVDSQNLLLKHLAVHRDPYEPDLSKNEEEEIKAAMQGPTSQDQFLSKIDLMPSSSQKEIKSIENKLTPQTLKNVLNNLKNSTGRLRYRCARCPYFSFCKNNISKHHKQHIIKSKFKCQHCDYSATRNFLRLQHMKFHENSDFSNAKSSDYQDIILDPYDEDGLKVLSSIQTPESTSTNGDDNIKDFSDENNENAEDMENMMEGEEDFDEEEMAALEQAEFEGLEDKKNSDVEMEVQDSDDSLSEMDPTAIQQQMSMNLSGVVGNEEKIRYTCSQCPYKCNALRSFKCHIHMHGLNKKYICDYCNWSADRLNLLYQHRKVHGKMPNYNPSPEDIVFLNRNFALENDGKSFMSPDDMSLDKQKNSSSPIDERALQRMSDRQFSGKKIYSCKLCPFSCNNKNSFAYHKNLHKIDARYTCNQCSYSIDRWNLLAQHMKLHKISNREGQDRSNNDEMNVSSPEVEPQLYFNAGDSLNESEVDSEEEKPQDWKCNRCPFSAASSEKLLDHSKQHHKHSRHSCPYCDFSDQEEQNMVEHVQLHFPSTKLEPEAVHAMLAKQGNKLPNSPEVPVVKAARRGDQQAKKSESDSTGERVEPSNDVQKSRTKVYVCPYCEREFDSKELMLKHERQHLIGSKY